MLPANFGSDSHQGSVHVSGLPARPDVHQLDSEPERNAHAEQTPVSAPTTTTQTPASISDLLNADTPLHDPNLDSNRHVLNAEGPPGFSSYRPEFQLKRNSSYAGRNPSMSRVADSRGLRRFNDSRQHSGLTEPNKRTDYATRSGQDNQGPQKQAFEKQTWDRQRQGVYRRSGEDSYRAGLKDAPGRSHTDVQTDSREKSALRRGGRCRSLYEDRRLVTRSDQQLCWAGGEAGGDTKSKEEQRRDYIDALLTERAYAILNGASQLPPLVVPPPVHTRRHPRVRTMPPSTQKFTLDFNRNDTNNSLPEPAQKNNDLADNCFPDRVTAFATKSLSLNFSLQSERRPSDLYDPPLPNAARTNAARTYRAGCPANDFDAPALLQRTTSSFSNAQNLRMSQHSAPQTPGNAVLQTPGNAALPTPGNGDMQTPVEQLYGRRQLRKCSTLPPYKGPITDGEHMAMRRTASQKLKPGDERGKTLLPQESMYSMTTMATGAPDYLFRYRSLNLPKTVNMGREGDAVWQHSFSFPSNSKRVRFVQNGDSTSVSSRDGHNDEVSPYTCGADNDAAQPSSSQQHVYYHHDEPLLYLPPLPNPAIPADMPSNEDYGSCLLQDLGTTSRLLDFAVEDLSTYIASK